MMQSIKDTFLRVVRYIPNQYRQYKESKEFLSVPVVRVTENVTSRQTKMLSEQLSQISKLKKVQAIAVLVDNYEGSAAQAHIIIQRLKI
jgi:hypothetical protein